MMISLEQQWRVRFRTFKALVDLVTSRTLSRLHRTILTHPASRGGVSPYGCAETRPGRNMESWRLIVEVAGDFESLLPR